MDSSGNLGGDLFRTKGSFEASLSTVNGAVSVKTDVTDPLSSPTEALELIYRESTDSWDILNLLTRERLGQVASGENKTALGITFSLVGDPINGDVITLHPKDRPAATFEVVINDIGLVATAETMRQTPSASNASRSGSFTAGNTPEGEADGLSVWAEAPE